LLQYIHLLTKFLEFAPTSRGAAVGRSCRPKRRLGVVPGVVSPVALFTVRLSNVHYAISDTVSHKINTIISFMYQILNYITSCMNKVPIDY